MGSNDIVAPLSGQSKLWNNGTVALRDIVYGGKSGGQAEGKCLDVLWLCVAGMAEGHVLSCGIPGIMLGMDRIRTGGTVCTD